MRMMFHEVSRQRSRMPIRVWGLASLLMAMVLVGPAAAAVPSQDAIVRPDPLVSAVSLGGQVVVNLYIQDVQGLYGADIRLGFDPAVLEVQDMDLAASGVQIAPLSAFLKPDFVVRNSACNEVGPACPAAGVVRYAVTQVNPSAPASGSGAIAAVTFKRLRSEVTTLRITAHDLSDRSGVTIPSVALDGSVELPVFYRTFLPLILKGQ